MGRSALIVASLGMVALFGFQQAAKPVKAPDFTAKASDGKTYTLASLTKDKTLVLYFIGHTCPVNAGAVTYYKQIQAAYKGKVNFIGVVDGDAKEFAEWQKTHDVKFPVLYDPELAIIRSYKAVASPWIVVVAPNGDVSIKQSGYSQAHLADLSATMAKASGVATAKLDFSSAPKEETFG